MLALVLCSLRFVAMRIGCLQFAPQVGDIDNNLNRADAALQRADVDSLDLLVLPELAFTGTPLNLIRSAHRAGSSVRPAR